MADKAPPQSRDVPDPASSAETQKEHVKDQARQASAHARQEAEARAERGTEQAAHQADALAGAARRSAEDLQAHGDRALADVLRSAADSLSSLADSLHHRSANDLLRDVERIARSNPALFIGGSIAVGIAASRLLKSGTTRGHADESGADREAGVHVDFGDRADAAVTPPSSNAPAADMTAGNDAPGAEPTLTDRVGSGSEKSSQRR